MRRTGPTLLSLLRGFPLVRLSIYEVPPVEDNRLRLIFTCCQPALALEA
jgi:hypothetical protein